MICKLYLNKAVKKLNRLHISISLYGGENCTWKTQRKTTESTLKIYRKWNKLVKANLRLLYHELKESRISIQRKQN